MSRRGNCYDNAPAEYFFSILKAECIRRHKLQTIEQARLLIDSYIFFYNHERIQLKITTTPKRGGLHQPYKGILLASAYMTLAFTLFKPSSTDYLTVSLKGFSSSFVVILSII
jgi:hypothetical protein